MNKDEINELVKEEINALNDSIFFGHIYKINSLEDDLASLKRMVIRNMDLATIENSRTRMNNYEIVDRVKIVFYLIIADLIFNSCFFIYHFIK